MPSKGKWKKVDRCIYRNSVTGRYKVIANVGGVERANYCEPDMTIEQLRQVRDGQVVDLREREPVKRTGKTFGELLDAYVADANIKEPSQLLFWKKTPLGDLPVHKHTEEMVMLEFDKMKSVVSARTIKLRRQLYGTAFHKFAGERARTPLDFVPMKRFPKIQRKKPVHVPDATILKTYNGLMANEQGGFLRDQKTRARFAVLATCGQRPAQVKRAKLTDITLYDAPQDGVYGLWNVGGAKGGEDVPLQLNEDQAAAWALFIKADAWGEYDTRSFARTLRSAGWPEGIRPYNVRHAFAITLRKRGIGLAEIQEGMGHKDGDTTRIYTGFQNETQEQVSKTLAGRFGFKVADPAKAASYLAALQRKESGRNQTSESDVDRNQAKSLGKKRSILKESDRKGAKKTLSA